MNTFNRRNRRMSSLANIDFQKASNKPTETEPVTEEVTETEATSNVIEETSWGHVSKGTFGISVKVGDKVVYENDKEPFTYDVVSSLPTAILYLGSDKDKADVLSDDQIEFIGQAFKSDDADIDNRLGKAVSELVKTLNNKLKADAKSSAYQSIVNKHKPLEGEKRETAMARTIANFIKLAGVTKEVAITQLKSIKALPEDYTVADYDSTPLRRTKGSDDDTE